MNEPREIWHFETRHIGRRVLVFDSLPSTNDYALQLNEPGAAIVADVQTAGRGQHQRHWQSPPGTSLLLSVTLAPPPELLRPVILIAWAAVAVVETIAELTETQSTIKWPNDVMLNGKKVCGILTESQRSTVVGLGLNLTQTQENFEQLPDATSLRLDTGIDCDSRNALGILLRTLDESYDRLLQGKRVTLESEWKSRIGLRGREVVAELSDGTVLGGRLIDMSFDAIELDFGDGAVRAIAPERIRLLRSETTV